MQRLHYPEQPWFVLSAAHRYALMTADDPAISHFYSFVVSPQAALTLAIPDGCVDILFDCDASRPLARVCGTPLQARSAEMKPGHRYFGVRFAPGVIPDFLDLMAEELTDHEFSFLDVVPNARQAFEAIVQSPHFSRQVALFNQSFMPRLTRRCSSITSLILQTIFQQRGNLRVGALEAVTGFTCRTIQRQFRQDTGLTPKAFCRIIRCQSALNRLHAPHAVSFLDLAYDLGFSDQSHFLREFKTLVSTTPLEYQRRMAQEAYQARLHYAAIGEPRLSA